MTSPEDRVARSTRLLNGGLAGIGTWTALSLPIGGLGRLFYVSFGEPRWFPWLDVVAVPAVLLASAWAAREGYRSASVSPRWARGDTYGLVILLILLALGASVWLATNNFAAAVVATIGLVVLAGVVALLVTGLRLTRRR